MLCGVVVATIAPYSMYILRMLCVERTQSLREGLSIFKREFLSIKNTFVDLGRWNKFKKTHNHRN